MKKLTKFLAFMVMTLSFSQNTVTIESSQDWIGYVNAFELDGTYAYGFDYPVSELKARATSASLILQPNTLIWANDAANDAWFDNSSGTQTPVKYIAASSYIEDATLGNEDLTFSGFVSNHNLDSNYTVVAFIKAIGPAPDFTAFAEEFVEITEEGAFSVTATASQLSATSVQYGFTVTGLPANPAYQTALGNVLIGVESPNAINNVTVETSQDWSGYVTAFDTATGNYAFGFGYPAESLRATGTTASMTLQPNVLLWTVASNDAVWFSNSSGIQTPLKSLESSVFVQNDYFAGSDLNFSGTVTLDNIDDSYSVYVFVKALDAANNYAEVVNYFVEITGTGDFLLSASAAQLTPGLLIQYGFTVTGLPGNPANDTALGSVVIRASTAGMSNFSANAVKMYPNPANGVVYFSSASNEVLEVAIYDLLGKQVLRSNRVQSQLNISSLNPGIYFVNMMQGMNVATKKLVVN